ncbi:MAG: type II toxin-antitoxin system mRNA interferase toxin, RelE/StbE family [Candidatus Kapabacteria bacterium]|nr:type II toxin-antitoxin system mRNA interferase toxin, RelE/StbE family [Candidatus Kapabacteria bacterium]
MIEFVWTHNFIRAVKKSIKFRPELAEKINFALELLESDIFHPLLHTHKLKGNLLGNYACTVEYDQRIIFQIRIINHNLTEIILLSYGSHDEVY